MAVFEPPAIGDAFADLTMIKSVLCVDDRPIDGEILERQLRRLLPTFDYHYAESCEAALELASRRHFDVAFVDYVMGATDGVELMRKLREQDPEVAVVMLTAHGNESVASECLRNGAVDYLRKTELTPSNLLRALTLADTLLRQHDADRQLAATNIALAEMIERAEAATRAKSEFLAHMSHEIRTPLTAILGFAEHLVDDDVTAAERKDCAKTILDSGRHLLAVVNDVLDLSKIEAGKMAVEHIATSPLEVASNLTAMLQPRAAAHGIELEFDAIGPVPTVVMTDPTRLRQILLNLISNAIKFTHQGSVLLLTHYLAASETTRATMEFSVFDSGIGMSSQDLERLFRPFTQAEASTAREYGGTGLGLAICRGLAELLGGELRVYSRVGKGSAFQLSLPIDPAEIPGFHSIEQFSIENARRRERPEQRLTGRLLVADDVAANQRLLERILTKAGATVATATNGQSAVEQALAAWHEGEPFDVILMDMQMPILDGFAAARRLREAGYRLPIVALSAQVLEQARAACLAVGCDVFIPKPIDRIGLIREIGDRIEAARQMRGE